MNNPNPSRPTLKLKAGARKPTPTSNMPSVPPPDKKAKLNHGEVRLVAQEGQILRLLRITGLLDVLRVYPDIDAALLGSTPLAGI